MAQPPEDEMELKDVVDPEENAVDDEGPAPEPVVDDIVVVLAEDEPVAEVLDDDGGLKPPHDDALLAVDDAEPDDEELDDEAKSYSKNVQARIKREQRVARRAREEGDQKASTERHARIEAERKTLRITKHLSDVTLLNIDNEIKQKQGALKAAKEAGETDDEVTLISDLGDLQGRKRELEDGKRQLEQQEVQFEEQAKRVTAPTETTPAAKDWIKRNAWVLHKAFKSEAFLTRALDLQVARTGLSPASPEYFRELDKAIAREMPLLKPKVQALARQTQKGVSQGAVAPGGRSAPGQSAARTEGRKTVTLDSADMQNMREFKLDPNNSADRVAYARTKLQGMTS